MNGLVAVGLVLLVAVIAWALRRVSVEAPASLPTPPAESDDAMEEVGPDEELAVTSDGALFIPDGHSIRIMPLDPDEMSAHHEDIEAGLFALSREERLQIAARQGKPGQALSPGDLTAARLRRGAAGVTPWLVETLGRDGEYIPFAFETEDGARAALALLERYGVVRRPLDDDGRPIPPSPEDFEEARRRYDESWRELALERDPTEDLGPPYSDRR